MRAFYDTTSSKMGISPAELYEQVKPNIQGMLGSEGGQQYDQPITQGHSWELGQRPGLMSSPDIPITSVRGDEFGTDPNAIRQGAMDRLNEIRRGDVPLVNQDTGWKLDVTRSDWSKLVKANGRGSPEQQAIAGLPDLVNRAVLAESHSDTRHNNPDVQGIHRLYAPLEIGGQMYRAKLTVRDYIGKDSGETTRLHALDAVEIENAPLGNTLTMRNPTDTAQTDQPTTGRALSIAELLRGSKREDGSPWSEDGKTFNQGEGVRGSYSPDTNTIRLLKDADTSTFLHESGHFFLNTLRNIAARPGAPDSIHQDIAPSSCYINPSRSNQHDNASGHQTKSAASATQRSRSA